MELTAIILVAAAVFGLCFMVDKGFSKAFRSKEQHKSGLSVRLSKRYGSIGVVILFLGIAAVITGIPESLLLMVCGGLLVVGGICLVVYYLTYTLFYDDDAFVYTSFGKKSKVYAYKDIKTQQLYNNYGATIIELHMTDGNAVQLQSGMDGVYPFLDKAFARWLVQSGRSEEDCPFHDPQNSCWFPPMED